MRVAIIPARGGSKRIPGKNIREFCGRPMISYSIEATRQSGLFEQVMVSTDCPRIAAVAQQWGADVPFLRPAHLADDHTSMLEPVRHAIHWLHSLGQEPLEVCCVFATAPLLQASMIREALDLLQREKASAVVPVATYPFHPYRGFALDDRGGLQKLFPQHFDAYDKNAPLACYDAGLFYWFNIRAFLEHTELFGPSTRALRVDRFAAQDINDEEDWQAVEYLYRVRQLQQAGEPCA